MLCLIAAHLDGKEISDYGDHLRRTLLLSPTIFPIIFAALMGRCFRYIGLFRAERGISLGRLEQLIGCQSLFTALERQIVLRSSSILGLMMTLVWLLSPLGGQSALRLLSQTDKSVHATDTFHFLNPDAMRDSFLIGASAANSGRITYTSMFLSALMSSSQYQASSMDLWGNVKIPAWRSVVTGADNGDGWKNVDISNGQNVTYASLIGIPVASQVWSESTYTIKTRQWDVTCDRVEEKSREDAKFGNLTSTWRMVYDNDCSGYPCPFTFKSLDNNQNYSVAECNLSFEYVEANITCETPSGCRTSSMRKLELFSDYYGPSNDSFTRSNMITIEADLLPNVDNSGTAAAGARQATNAENWMANPWDFMALRYGNVDLYELPPALLGERLTIIWNTFWHSTYATSALGGNLPKNLTALSDQQSQPNLQFLETKAQTVDKTTIVYKTNWQWFTALIISAAILQIAAYTGLVLKYMTLAPDIIGYASSLTLLNPYIPVPTGGTTLHGLERAALLHDLPIKIGDVCANEPVGAIAVAKGDDSRVGRLDRKRWYI